MFSLFKILFLLASFLPLIFAGCTSGEIPPYIASEYLLNASPCCQNITDGFIDLSNVTKINKYAFFYCKKLTSVSFGKKSDRDWFWSICFNRNNKTRFTQ